MDINALLRTLIEFREGDWKATGIRVRDLTSRETLNVLGSQGQLEQVFLNLFVHAEQSLAGAEQKVPHHPHQRAGAPRCWWRSPSPRPRNCASRKIWRPSWASPGA